MSDSETNLRTLRLKSDKTNNQQKVTIICQLMKQNSRYSLIKILLCQAEIETLHKQFENEVANREELVERNKVIIKMELVELVTLPQILIHCLLVLNTVCLNDELASNEKFCIICM
jgi:hypothetical protein